MYDNPWYFDNKIFDSEHIGDAIAFVYCITHISTQKKYIGKKTFFFKKILPKNSKRKRRQILKVESDWRDYYGSSPEIIKDVEKLGKENFGRKILRLCKSKGEVNYFEAKYIFETDAILSENYYNSWITCKIMKSHIKF